jgi:glutaminyl-peptide cyclotransferase
MYSSQRMNKFVLKKRLYIFVPLLITIFVVVIVMYNINTHTSPSEQFYDYKIVNTYPHDPNAFTQGLVYDDGFLYEGTGLEGYSSIRKIDYETGKVLKIYNLPGKYFGEGITIFGDKIIQLTYKSQTGFVYDKKTFELLRQFKYNSEGWGLTNDGMHLIMSDGSPTLYFYDPNSFELISKVAVYYKGSLLRNLNELEYIDGKIYANIWQTDYIAIIDPKSGQVTGIIDLKGLLKAADIRGRIDVLNGMAYDAKKKRLFVTGKWWPKLFEIKLIPVKQDE